MHDQIYQYHPGECKNPNLPQQLRTLFLMTVPQRVHSELPVGCTGDTYVAAKRLISACVVAAILP